MTTEEVKELRAVKDDSPMTDTMVYKNIKEKNGVVASTCWDTGCTFPISSLAVIKQLKADIIPLTQDLTVIEASGSELKILGTAIIFMKSKILGEEKKQLEVAVIEGVEGNKEILVSLKLMKAWKMVHETFPRERVDDYMIRINEANKYDEHFWDQK